MINIDNTIFNSSFSGLSNISNANLLFNMNSQTLSPNEFRVVGSPSINLNNTNAITSIEVNFGNIETVWRPVTGYLQKTIGGPSYDIICIPKYNGSILTITLVIADDTGLSNTVPAIAFNFRINTYLAPF